MVLVGKPERRTSLKTNCDGRVVCKTRTEEMVWEDFN